MPKRKPRKAGRSEPRGRGQQPRGPKPGSRDQESAGVPEVYGVESEADFPSEADYGNQVTEYDDAPPGRGHGDAGYGYGSETGFGPSGGSGVEKK